MKICDEKKTKSYMIIVFSCIGAEINKSLQNDK